MKTATPKGKLTQYIGLKEGSFEAKNIGLTSNQLALCVFLILCCVIPACLYYFSIKVGVSKDEAAAKNLAKTSLSGQQIKPYLGEATAPRYNKTMAAVREYAESKLSLGFDRLTASDGTENGYCTVNVNPRNASKSAGKVAAVVAAVTTTAPAIEVVPTLQEVERKFRAEYKAASADEKIEMLEARIKGKLEGGELDTHGNRVKCFTTLFKKYSKVLADPECNKTGEDYPFLKQLANLCSTQVENMFKKTALFNELNRIKNPDARLNRLEQIASGSTQSPDSMSKALKALVIDKPHYYAAALADPKCSKTIADCPNLIQMLEGGGNLAVSLSAYESLVEQLESNIVSVDTENEGKVFLYLEKLNNIIPLMYSDRKSREFTSPQKVLLSGLITKAQALQKSLQGKLNALRQGNRNPLLEAALGREGSETEALNAILPPFLSPAGSSPTMVNQNLLDPKGSPPRMVNPWA